MTDRYYSTKDRYDTKTEMWHKSKPLDIFNTKILIDVDELVGDPFTLKRKCCPLCGKEEREYDPPV